MIDVNNITKKYSSTFDLNIDYLAVKNTEKLALVGANGSGKSTLLKLVDKVIKPDSGEIKIECDLINDIYYQPQTPFLLNSSVYDNIALGFGGKKNGLTPKQRNEKLLFAAERCELIPLLNKNAYILSGGEKQRVFFSRLLIKARKLLLLDEPFSAMDIEYARMAEDILIDYCRDNGSTLLLCTHLPSQAMRVCERIIIMHKGKIIEDGKTSEIIASPKTEWGAKFISQWRVD